MTQASRYAGIGSRQTPVSILHLMLIVAKALSRVGWILRSGGATGADTSFEAGATHKEIYLPWKNYNGNKSPLYHVNGNAIRLASRYHPNWSVCKDGVRKLHGRNAHIILGPQLNDPAGFVICWTVGASLKGGTGMGIRIALDNSIPVYNLARKEDVEIIQGWIKQAGLAYEMVDETLY